MDQSITSLGDNEVELETGYSHILGAPGLLVFGDTVTAEMLVTVRETASVGMSLTGWTL